MSIINVLDKQTANLIAAGEVVDRPASVAKELVENAIDAGADAITVEIKNGGSTLIRITDNGKGMTPEDVRLSVLRHATSKISAPKDLDGIKTLGFRGEALAAISSVSRFQIISKTKEADFGICMFMEGETEVSFEEVGCPNGTTVTVRDIFFNVPARRKFLKKDQTETAYIAHYMERIALSHPNISFKFIADSRTRFSTSGNGDLKTAVYSVFGKEFADSLIPVEMTHDKIRVWGLVSLPDKSRVNRSFQIFFINGRFVRTKIALYALEDAYKTYIFNERYPACVLFVEIDPYQVDVNVHPSKLEVRFVDEASVRQAIYFTVRNAIESIKNPIAEDVILQNSDVTKGRELLYFKPEKTDIKREQVTFKPSFISKPVPPPPKPMNCDDSDVVNLFSIATPISSEKTTVTFSDCADTMEAYERLSALANSTKTVEETVAEYTPGINASEKSVEVEADRKTLDLVYCGNVFDTYIIAQYADNMYIVDKHAAHERILYESLKSKKDQNGVQMLIDPIVISFTSEEFDVAMSNLDDISSIGFDYSEVGPNSIALRGIPTEFSGLDMMTVESVFAGIISDIMIGRRAKESRDNFFDRALFTAACRAAVKGGIPDSAESYRYLLKQVSMLDNIFCCPHGRPIIVKYTKQQIEKMFFRT